MNGTREVDATPSVDHRSHPSTAPSSLLRTAAFAGALVVDAAARACHLPAICHLSGNFHFPAR